MLLFWPCAWGLTLAYDFSSSLNIYFFYLILFFLGQYAASLAGTEEKLVLGGGVLLLLLEIFVIPGFGVAGVLGILLLITALLWEWLSLACHWTSPLS